MSQPLKLRRDDESGTAPVPPLLTVLPPPVAATETEPNPIPPGATSLHGGNFLSPEEVDVEAGFKQQAEIDAAEERPWRGCVGGAMAALACTLAAGGTAALTGYWYGFLSIGIGFVVAFGVRKLGRGNNVQFGIIGATWSLLGCMGAYHLASAIVMARVGGVSLLEFIRSIESWSSFMEQVLGPNDFVFHALAALFGYRYSHDAVADKY